MIPHLYIHIPFCSSKCGYCAFYSETGVESSVITLYPAQLGRELSLRVNECDEIRPMTIYTGGGTPSLLGPNGFRNLNRILRDIISFGDLAEWSVELNPASTTPQLLETIISLGVNRITFGAQSFDNSILNTIGRAHYALDTINAVNAARSAGFTNLGVDLIAGLPGSDTDTWKIDLDTAIQLSPQHISVYSLSIESGTKLETMKNNGLQVPGDEEQLERLSEASTRLAGAGFTRYEISNYSLPGYECKHNLGIWKGNDYLGIGPAAASRIGNMRYENNASLREWIDAIEKALIPPGTIEALSNGDDAMERTLFQLRLQEGFSPEESAGKYPILQKMLPLWREELAMLEKSGAVTFRNGRWSLTPRGMEICDYVIREML